ncbi:MAG: glycosyltransferase, partial [Acetobacteraceae bacterium]
MSAGPKVSVALPVRNGLPHLAEAVEALRRQTFRDFELVVQDALSTDGSVDYLRRAGLPFPVRLVSERDGSLVAGYNRAVRRCTGDLVVAAACDEVLDDDALEQYVSWYDENPSALYIYGGSRILEPSGTLREFQPKDFRLIDYVRHQTCPTTAGAFNRGLLGREFYFDESLKTVPDFEFFTRVALRFGEGRILCKRAITMTARGDETSTSFRPSAFGQFAHDKRIVIDRLTKGRLRRALLERLRSDAIFHMHAQFAEQIHGLAGDGPLFREQVLAAQAAMPGHPEVRRLAAMSRHFLWDEAALAAILRRNVAPLPPPR